MRGFVIMIAVGVLLAMPAVRSGGPNDDSSVLTAAVVVEDQDFNMKLALDCLTQIRDSKANEGDTVLVKLLEATGFKLEKVLAKEFKDGSSRLRFGFEYGNGDALKTVYWETDCAVGKPAGQMASR